MDNQLIYIIGFAVITLIALVVSLSVKFEHRKQYEHYGHDYDHEDTIKLTDELKPLAYIQNQSGDSNIMINKDTTETETISDLNTRFAFRKAADYSNADALKTVKVNNSTVDPTVDPIVLYTGDNFLINRGIVLSSNLFTLASGEDNPYDRNLIMRLEPSRGTVAPGFGILDQGGAVNVVGNTISSSDSTSSLKIFATDTTKSELYKVLEEDVNQYEPINKIEYFGLTSDNNFPVPLFKADSIINSLAGDNYISGGADISTINLIRQVYKVDPDTTTDNTLRMGLFAKTSTSNAPGVGTIGDYTGFDGITKNYKILNLINFAHQGTATVPDAMYIGQTTDGNPNYVIHVIKVDKDKCPSKISCISQIKNVQVAVLLVGVSVINATTATIKDRSSLTDTDAISFKKGQYYYQDGKENIYSIVFFRFNHDGNKRTYEVDVLYDEDIGPYVSGGGNNTTHDKPQDVNYINYYKFSNQKVQTVSYENYYYYNEGRYTWKYRNGEAWADVST